MAKPNAPSSATKRTLNDYFYSDKRQKTLQQDNKKTVHDFNTVLLERAEAFVAQVPIFNFQTFVPARIKDLIEVSDTDARRWQFYTYAIPDPDKYAVNDIKLWDLRAMVNNDPEDASHISAALVDAEALGDTDHMDALIDNLVSWLQAGMSKGSLDVTKLRCNSYDLLENHACWEVLGIVLILHHDAEAAMSGRDTVDVSAYDSDTCRIVQEAAMMYFAKPEREPKDPLQLSVDEFCQKYHTHHKQNLPCYKTKKWPPPSD
ncbi:hypothetical protein QM012_006994 [Aureobasidium pullulans]|uniref:Uncharacterized protein n=1 Tax=Aureobasidium pullulans TaxID=5580 RepID=A0ABR0TQ55_AURPU